MTALLEGCIYFTVELLTVLLEYLDFSTVLNTKLLNFCSCLRVIASLIPDSN